MELGIIKRIILESLITPPRWGGKHTEIRNIKKGFPLHISNSKEGQKLIDKAIKELINDAAGSCARNLLANFMFL